MNTMIISPIQNDYVTKQEFGDFKTEMYDFKSEMYTFKDEMHNFKLNTEIRFDNVEHSIKELKTFVIDGFEKTYEYIDESKKEIIEQIGKQISELSKKIK